MAVSSEASSKTPALHNNLGFDALDPCWEHIAKFLKVFPFSDKDHLSLCYTGIEPVALFTSGDSF